MDRMIVQWTGNDALNHFDSYFRVVRHLLTEAEGLLGKQHHRYVALFRSQLSRSELVLLGYYFWLDPDGDQVLNLAETYSLLTDLPRGDLRTELETEFDCSLFGATSSKKQEVLTPPDIDSPTVGSSASTNLSPDA